MRLNHMDPSNDIKRALMFGHITDPYEYYNFPPPMCYDCFILDSYIVYDITFSILKPNTNLFVIQNKDYYI